MIDSIFHDRRPFTGDLRHGMVTRGQEGVGREASVSLSTLSAGNRRRRFDMKRRATCLLSIFNPCKRLNHAYFASRGARTLEPSIDLRARRVRTVSRYACTILRSFQSSLRRSVDFSESERLELVTFANQSSLVLSRLKNLLSTFCRLHKSCRSR